jgi:hypothetical protein
MWIVKHCVRDYDEVLRNEVAQFATEVEADQFAESANNDNPFKTEWFEAVEEQPLD